MLLNLFRSYLGNVKHRVRRTSRRRVSGFRNRPMVSGLQRRSEQLEDRTLLAAQVFSANTTTLSANPGGTVNVPVFYQTLNDADVPTALLTNTFTVRIHFNSSDVTPTNSPGNVPNANVNVLESINIRTDAQADSSNLDNDMTTDMFILVSYLDDPFATVPGFPDPPLMTDTPLQLFFVELDVDGLFTGSSQINFSGTPGVNAGVGGFFEFRSQSVTLESPPTVSIAPASNATSGNGSEAGLVNGEFTVTQTAITAADTVINYSITGTATEGSDFSTIVTKQVTILAGDTTATISIPVLNDNSVEASETVIVMLDSIDSSSPGVAINTASDDATINIVDDDTAAFTINNVSVDEADGTLTFTVSTVKSLDIPIDVSVAYTDVSTVVGDFDHTTDVANFLAGETSKMVTVAITNDTTVEATETFTASLSSATALGGRSVTFSNGTGTITDTDAAVVSINSPTAVTEGSPIAFSVTIDNPVDLAVSATRATANVTTTDSDYTVLTAASVQLFAANSTTAFAIPVTTTNDDVVEIAETLNLILSSLSAGGRNVTFNGGGGMLTGVGTINDNDTATFSIANASGDENGTLDTNDGRVTFTVVSSNPIDTAVMINVSFSDMLAAAGFDFAGTTQMLTFNALDTSEDVSVTVSNDMLIEGDETFGAALALTAGQAAALGTRTVVATDTATGTINDNDTAVLSFDLASSSVTEGDPLDLSNPMIDVDVSLVATANGTINTGTLAANVTVDIDDLQTVGGDSATRTVDYSGNDPESLMFNMGTGSGSGTLTLTILPDLDQEANETIDLALNMLTGPATIDTNADTHQVTIIDNDTPSVSVALFGGTAVNENDNTALVYRFTRDGDQAQALNINFSVTGGTAGSAEFVVDDSPANVTFSGTTGVIVLAGGSGSFDLSITPVGDDLVELDETIQVNVLAQTPLDTTYNVGVPVSGTGTITNDDMASLSIGNVTAEENGTFTFTISSDLMSSEDLTVRVNTGDGTATVGGGDYTAISNLLATIMAGTLSTTVDVDVTNDDVVEADETFSVTISDPRFDGVTDGTRVVIGTPSATGTITDNDIDLSIAADDASKDEGQTGNTQFTFTVTRSGETDGTTTVDFDVTGTGGNPATAADFGGALPGDTVTFDPGDTTKTITINVSGDRDVEPNEDFTVTLSNAADDVTAHEVQIATASASSTITNDDVDLAIVRDDASKAEGLTGDTAFTFTVTRTGETDGTTTVDFAVTGTGTNPATAADFNGGVFPSDTVTFTAGQTMQTITVNVNGDSTVELDEDFVVTLSNAADTIAAHAVDISTATATSTITNDDTAVISVEDESVNEADGMLTFTITSSNAIDIDVSIDVTYTDDTANAGFDFDGTANMVVLLAGTTSVTVDVPIMEDTDPEEDETFFLATVSLSWGMDLQGRPVTFPANPAATGTIVDNDAARVTVAVAPADPDFVDENGGVPLVYTFTSDRAAPVGGLTLAFAVGGDAKFSNGVDSDDDYTVSGAASFSATAGTVVIPAGDMTATINVLPIDDAETEGTVGDADETVIITLIDDGGANSGLAYNLDPPTSATGNIRDDEAEPTDFIVNLTDGVADDVVLIVESGKFVVRTSLGALVEERAISSTRSITINAGINDSDVVSIDFSGGNPIPGVDPMFALSGGLTVNGGAAGNDTVTLDNVGTTFATHTYDLFTPTDGLLTLNDGIENFTFTFNGLEQPLVNDGTADDVFFNLPLTGNEVTLEDFGTTTDGFMSLTNTNGTTVSTRFLFPESSLTVNAGAGNDMVTFNSVDESVLVDTAVVVNTGIGTTSTIQVDLIDRDVQINGDGGNDTLVGSPFNDSMNGGAGNDVVNGRAGGDTLNGDGDNDTLLGGADNDLLFGGDGNDKVKGQGGVDTLGGGFGNDTLEGGSSVSALRDGGNANITISSNGTAIVLAGLGTDTVIGTYTQIELFGGSSGNTLDASAFNGNVTLDGAGGDDTLIGTSNADSLLGRDGTDRALLRVRGNVVVRNDGVFGPGGDIIESIELLTIEIDDPSGARVDASAYTASGTRGVVIIGSDGRDTIIGSPGNDFLNGRDGRDNIFGGNGNDTLLGGGGFDLLSGGSGNDKLQGNSGIDTLSGGAGDDRLIGGNQRTVLLEGGNEQTIRLQSNNELPAPADEGITGDVLVVSTGKVATISGAGLGNDTLVGSYGELELQGGPGPNRIDASRFAFSVTLRGGGGDDTLLGSAQGDVLDGQDGTDRIVQSFVDPMNPTLADLEQTLSDTLATGRGADTLSSVEEAVLIGGSFGTNIDARNFTGNVTLIGNGGGDTLLGGSGNDLLDGGDGNDKIFGFAGDDTADGADGNDSVIGGNDDDVLLGGDGNDTIRGEAGDDLLLGEAGADDIDGGAGTNSVAGGGNTIAAEGGDVINVGDMGTVSDAFSFDFDILISSF